ncbi:hypothetical protein [Armatimonas sp.]|uniref:hypothetical protein n=1 Tax=Armatimonas sp. TaxID=1872638 RepID=UPI00286B459B|nr:hypothetical protein [Armatimonas sp.]
MINDPIVRLIENLESSDYSQQLIALGKLVELGNTAIPYLDEALYRCILPARIHAACAMAAIGSHDPRIISGVIQLWEKHPRESLLNHALLVLVKNLSSMKKAESIPALILFLPCFAWKSVNSEGQPDILIKGKEISLIAAEGLRWLANHQPSRQLRDALPYLKRGLFSTKPQEFDDVRKVIEEKTQQWKDLPLVADAPKNTENLPLPADEEVSHG